MYVRIPTQQRFTRPATQAPQNHPCRPDTMHFSPKRHCHKPQHGQGGVGHPLLVWNLIESRLDDSLIGPLVVDNDTCRHSTGSFPFGHDSGRCHSERSWDLYEFVSRLGTKSSTNSRFVGLNSHLQISAKVPRPLVQASPGRLPSSVSVPTPPLAQT